ncbi:MAG: protein kinase [Planctomycetes bacterium]|nr:protein kinase [Planctomycetota bacterium]
MNPEGKALSKRDRALAELVRVRGWADDPAIERAIAEASDASDLGSVLISSRLLTPEQLRTLQDAIDGVSTRSSVKSGSNLERTVAKSDPGATVVPGPKKMPDQIGPYRLLRELGRGGMGVVFRALDPELRREVALKVMIGGAQANESDVERFRREAAVVARMGRHPNLIAIHDIGRDGERLYFTMDFIEGRSAKQRVEEEGAYPPREAARIAAEIAGALAFAHKAGVVHRDVKPHNILVDPQGKPFLGDFGLARDLAGAAGLTESGSAFGTPAYMSPEQAAGKASEATALSDVYSLGATLYEMATGRIPFEGESGMEIVRRVIDTDPKPLRAVREGIHRDLEVIVLKAMHKVPERRYAGAAEMEADLRRFLNGEPILARPASALEKMWNRARRHRAVVSVSAAGLLVAAGIGGWAWWSLRQKDLRDRREQERRVQRAQEATPKFQDGCSLIDRSDRAHESGGWKDRDRYAAEAVKLLEEAAGINPDDAEIRYQLGRALRRAGRPDDALRALEQAVKLNPRHPGAWYEHGAILQERLTALRGELVRSRPFVITNDVGFAPSGLTGGFVAWEADPAGDTSALRAAAARDFQHVVDLGAAAEPAAYGRAMLLFFENRHEEALREIDAALAANPYSVDALKARADILETWTRDISRGLDDRARLHRLQPYNPAFAIDYAISLVTTDRRKEALEVLDRALDRGGDDPMTALQAARIRLQCGDAEACRAAALRILGDPGAAHRAEAAKLLVAVAMLQGDLPGAQALLDEHAALMEDDFATALRAEVFFFQARHADAARAYRKLTPGTFVWKIEAGTAAYAEWLCGNLDRATEMAEAGAAARVAPAERMMRGIVRMEAGDFKGALEDFEAVKRAFPVFNANHSNLAGARFLSHDWTGAIQALEDGVLTTPMPRKQREAVQMFFKPQKERAAQVQTPAEAARVVETLAGILTLAGSQAADARTRAGVREGLRGLLYVLQRFYTEEKMYAEAIGAGKRCLAIVRSGSIHYRDAVARSLSGDAEGALKALEDAAELGFDDGKRLDSETAFDSFRAIEGFVALRRRCRD